MTRVSLFGQWHPRTAAFVLSTHHEPFAPLITPCHARPTLKQAGPDCRLSAVNCRDYCIDRGFCFHRNIMVQL